MKQLSILFVIMLFASATIIHGMEREDLDLIEEHLREACVGRRDCLVRTYFYAGVLCFYCCVPPKKETVQIDNRLYNKIVVVPRVLGEDKDK